MSTKHTSQCLLKAGDDEPIFVLRAKDPTSPEIIRAWVHSNATLQPKDKLLGALQVAEEMEEWWCNNIRQPRTMYKSIYGETEIQARQFDGTVLLDGMDWDMGGAFIRSQEGKIQYVNAHDYLIDTEIGYMVMSKDDFENNYHKII